MGPTKESLSEDCVSDPAEDLVTVVGARDQVEEEGEGVAVRDGDDTCLAACWSHVLRRG